MKTGITPQEVIRKKRDGSPLSHADLGTFIAGLTTGKTSDAQIAAFTMATLCRGMLPQETVALTHAMRDSGETLHWNNLDGPVADKHSTGGVGDTVSLILGPLAAACGLFIPMISGRGLGHTGGTLDKLESIPGYNIRPDTRTFQAVVKNIGVAIVGQTHTLAPADRKIYAVRDVTATVESLPLITASILSKKLAAGISSLIMDVKTGNGAFMTDLPSARELAHSIVQVSKAAGLPARAFITDMHQPLASSVGNALEMAEAVRFLTNNTGNPRLRELTFSLTAEMLALAGLTEHPRATAERALDSGAAAEKFAQMISALGGPHDFLEKSHLYLKKAPHVIDIPCQRSGYLSHIATRDLGEWIIHLGGGRLQSNDTVDPSVGLSDIAQLGDNLHHGDLLCRIHSQNPLSPSHGLPISACFTLTPDPQSTPPLIYGQVNGKELP